MLRWWSTYEQGLLAWLNRFPRSATSRERKLMLSVIRLVALSLALLVIGLLGVSVSGLENWLTGAAAGAVTMVAGLTLLTLAMALDAILVIVYGD
ncbi:MAG: hypothetical protein KGO05_07650 [Chloroflexota bacterium]|nr:hypothetical protein [Chloroflexota bacterium]